MYSVNNGPFLTVQGRIVDAVPAGKNDRAQSCAIYFTVEDGQRNIVTVVVTPNTFVADWKPLNVGQEAIFWHRADAPMLLIYPPRYTAAAAAPFKSGRMYDVSFYDDSLVNAERTLQLHLDRSVMLRTSGNQYFQGNPANHELFVSYTNSTRSIPAQTTPTEVIVLCGGTNP